jgi:single-strand DNA-binding protein
MGKDYVSCSTLGRAVADVELKYLPNQTAFAKVRVAVSDDYFNKDAKEWVNQSDFFDFVIWGDRAASFSEKVSKGDRVLLEWRPRNNNYEKDGKTVYGNDFIVVNYHLIEKRSSQGNGEASQRPAPTSKSTKPTKPASSFDEEDAPF